MCKIKAICVYRNGKKEGYKTGSRFRCGPSKISSIYLDRKEGIFIDLDSGENVFIPIHCIQEAVYYEEEQTYYTEKPILPPPSEDDGVRMN